MFKGILFFLLSLCLTLSFTPHLLAADECKTIVGFDHSKARNILHQISSRANQVPLFSKKEIETFLKSGWPAFLNMAKEGEVTPEQLFDLMFETLKLSMEVFKETSKVIADLENDIDEKRTTVHNLIGWLVLKNPAKLKPKDNEFIEKLMWQFLSAAGWAMSSELTVNSFATTNPLTPLNDQQIIKIFRTIQELSEEATLQYIQGSEAKSLVSQIEESKVQEEKKEQQAPHLTIPETKISLPIAEKPLLANLLKKNPAPMDSELKYELTNHQGMVFTIQFGKPVAKQFNSTQMQIHLQRLLSTLFTGNGSTSGVKFLQTAQLGLPKDIRIVEIKAIMNGHHRLLGWMKGRHLQIETYLSGEGNTLYRQKINALVQRLN